MENEILERVWTECLALWKYLSELPDEETALRGWAYHCESIKQGVLEILGIGYRINGCPFCEEFLHEHNCPFGDCGSEGSSPCYNTPYKMWEDETDKGWHRQELARDFYEYLLKKKEV